MNREEKLLKLREIMKNEGIAAVIIPSTDPHSSEYVHGHWKTRGWYSEFTGSAGTLVITLKESGLWTDFRYFIQASEQLDGSEIKLYKMGNKDVPTITEFLESSLNSGDVIGIDGTLFPTSSYTEYKNRFDEKGITFNKEFDSTILWTDRPANAASEVFELDVKYSGESTIDKISRVQSIMKDKKVDSYIISSLADIAWLFNIRAADVDYTPLAISYAIIYSQSVNLFIDDKKLPMGVKSSLEKSGVTISSYTDIADSIVKLKSDSTVYFMAESVNCFLSGLIPDICNVKTGMDITEDLKSIKNSTEIANVRIAMEKDGAALVKFFKAFNEKRATETFTEYSLAPMLREARLSMDGCVDESFDPIIGYRSNGALCHYSAEEDSALTIGPEGLLLIDSGGQYYQGTTDITRTITLGKPTVEEILHYTLVLKGHLKLNMCKYPEGTKGGQLDVLARQPLWDYGLNFGHGTGHGVGYFLGVHEGPQNISPKSFKAELKEGMITSNEPGLYIEGKHGIRIENLVLTKFSSQGVDQKFYEFETLTLYPYDINLIDPDLLTEEELNWINTYHTQVQDRLEPYLEPEEIKWLETKTREI
ncbi:MAG: aminopeptidase P family protein [Spirochaetaceae bacterium]